MTNYFDEEVLSVEHLTERLFSFTTTRSPAFRFSNGQFVMLGLPLDRAPVMRAYSIASPEHAGDLSFYSIKVPDGPLTSRLQKLQAGDRVLIGRKTTGTLVLDGLRAPGRVLYLLCTGTGVAPFVATINDPRTYEAFDHVVLAHGCRRVAELTFGARAVEAARRSPLVSDAAGSRLLHAPSVTREPFATAGRVTDRLQSGALSADLGLPPVDPAHDRVMVCGSPDMVRDSRRLFQAAGFAEGSLAHPGDFVIERAFVDG
jgi:ferredoxin--NADP+ reductase